MLLLCAIALLGLIQACFVAADLHKQWRLAGLYCLLPGLLVYGLSAEVERVSFNRLTEILLSESIAFYMAALMVLESLMRAASLIFRCAQESTSGERARTSFPASCTGLFLPILPHLPPLSLLLFVFYGQAWLFHAVEGFSFKWLSLVMAIGLSAILLASVLFLRPGRNHESFKGTVYDLLFLQLVIAVSFPLMVREGPAIPPFYDAGIYFRAASTLCLMLFFGLLGYGLYQFFKYRRKEI